VSQYFRKTKFQTFTFNYTDIIFITYPIRDCIVNRSKDVFFVCISRYGRL